MEPHILILSGLLYFSHFKGSSNRKTFYRAQSNLKGESQIVYTGNMTTVIALHTHILMQVCI